MRSFENLRVLVTGSGRGIGKGIARRFAQGGAKILLVARSRDELEQPLAEFSKEINRPRFNRAKPPKRLASIEQNP